MANLGALREPHRFRARSITAREGERTGKTQRNKSRKQETDCLAIELLDVRKWEILALSGMGVS